MRAYLVDGVYCGDRQEGTYATLAWAECEEDAEKICLAEMDAESEYCCGSNEVVLVTPLENYIAEAEAWLARAREFLNNKPESK